MNGPGHPSVSPELPPQTNRPRAGAGLHGRQPRRHQIAGWHLVSIPDRGRHCHDARSGDTTAGWLMTWPMERGSCRSRRGHLRCSASITRPPSRTLVTSVRLRCCAPSSPRSRSPPRPPPAPARLPPLRSAPLSRSPPLLPFSPPPSFDEPIDVREKEAYVPGMDEIIERRLNDGRAFRVVKNFIDPEALQARLREMGWAGEIRGSRRSRQWDSSAASTGFAARRVLPSNAADRCRLGESAGVRDRMGAHSEDQSP